MADTELVVIDERTRPREFEQQLQWSAAYYRLARGI
jgi:L-arabinose isomerase